MSAQMVRSIAAEAFASTRRIGLRVAAEVAAAVGGNPPGS